MKFYKSNAKEENVMNIDSGSTIFFINKSYLKLNYLNIIRYITLGEKELSYKEFKNMDACESIVFMGENVLICEPLLYAFSDDNDDSPDAFRCTAMLNGDGIEDGIELCFILHVSGAAVTFDIENDENMAAFEKYFDENPNKHIRVVCTHGTQAKSIEDNENGLALTCFINIEVFVVDNN